jgi:hypothetical protein
MIHVGAAAMGKRNRPGHFKQAESQVKQLVVNIPGLGAELINELSTSC